jgi:hypothetical protein
VFEMSLIQDMKPDLGWKRRGNVDRDGRTLSFSRANELDAVLSMRSALLWMVILTTYGGNRKIEPFAYPITSDIIGFAYLLAVLAWILITFFDYPRRTAINKVFSPENPKAIHGFEEWAIPLLCFLFIGSIAGFVLLGTICREFAPSMLPYLRIFKDMALSPPWMGLTALMVATGAYYRWKMAKLGNAQRSYDAI